MRSGSVSSLFGGFERGFDIGGAIADRRRRRRLEEEMRAERERRRRLEEEDRAYGRQRDAAGDARYNAETTYRRDRDARRDALEEELRRMRMGQATQGAIEDQAGGRAREFGNLDELETELQRIGGIADADMTPEMGALESALRQRQVAVQAERQRQAAGGHTPRETVEWEIPEDPEDPDGPKRRHRVTRAFSGEIPSLATPPLIPEGQAQSAAGASAGPVQIRTEAEYQQLPSGTEYIDPNGMRRRKR